MSISNDCDHTDRFCACDVTQSKPKHLGNLTLWFRLTCELEVLKSLYNNSEQQWGPQSDTQGRARDIDETNDKPKSIAAHEEQTQNTFSLHRSPCSALQSNMPKTLITLSIIGLKFNSDFELPNADKADQIYVEFSFLGTRRLKTDLKPMSTNEIIFDFTQKFPQSDRNVQRLMNILKDPEQSIKLTLVKTKTKMLKTNTCSELDMETDSIEIGFGLLYLGKIVSEWHESATEPHIFDISVLSKQPPYQNIGCLDIFVEEISSLKLLHSNI